MKKKKGNPVHCIALSLSTGYSKQRFFAFSSAFVFYLGVQGLWKLQTQNLSTPLVRTLQQDTVAQVALLFFSSTPRPTSSLGLRSFCKMPGDENPIYIRGTDFYQRAAHFLTVAWYQKDTYPSSSPPSLQLCALCCHSQSQRREFWPKPLQKIKSKCQVSP